jgi:hypothetical protein
MTCGVHRISRLYKLPSVTAILIFELIFIYVRKIKKEFDNSIIYVDATKMYKNRHDNKFVIHVLNFEI